jgi:hypothetical protein
MQFTFKRDGYGHERVYVGDVCVATIPPTESYADAHRNLQNTGNVPGATIWNLAEAMDRAWAANFWPNFMEHRRQKLAGVEVTARYDEVTVEVPT